MMTSIKQLVSLNVGLYRHSSAKNLIMCYYGKTYDDIRGDKDFFRQISDIYEGRLTIKEVIEETKGRGLWGYCIVKKGSNEREIHYWVDRKKVGACDIGELLCHEMAHAIGINSEQCAIKYAYVASTVIQILKRNGYIRENRDTE